MKGIGIASFLIVTTVTLFYTTIIGRLLSAAPLNWLFLLRSSCPVLSDCFDASNHALECLFTSVEYCCLFRTDELERNGIIDVQRQ